MEYFKTYFDDVDFFGTQNEMNHLHQMVHHHQNGVIRTRRWKIMMKSMGNENHRG
jgi:hypothetical protein